VAADSDADYYRLVNEMLFELDVSHIGVLTPDDLQALAPLLTAEGWLGIDVRLIDGQAVIAFIEPGSPGAEAGLRPGYVIQSIDGKTVEQIITDTKPMPPRHDRNHRRRVTDAIQTPLYGTPESSTAISYLDEYDDPHSNTLVQSRRAGSVSTQISGDESLPEFFIEFDAKRLRDDIGYIRFNGFFPPVDQRFLETVDSMKDSSGLIIDLRGNQGGLFYVRKALAEKLVGERTLIWRYEEREGVNEVYLDPAKSVYQGIVVVLIDILSISSAEEFAGGMQAIGRAVIVGERSPGIVLTAQFSKLPNGALLVYPDTRTTTADGSVLEKHGVTPDIEVALQRRLLLQGADSQLQAAIRYIQAEARK
jgi:carboxyl-terminal processing protease